jgi:hypothetical protein
VWHPVFLGVRPWVTHPRARPPARPPARLPPPRHAVPCWPPSPISQLPFPSNLLHREADLWIKGTALAGTLFGQIIFGILGDFLGRKKVYL